MCRVVQGWIARPFHPELDRYLRAGVSCSHCKFCAERDIFPEEREKLARAPAARGARGAKASADGARRTSPGRRAGAKRPLRLALIKRPLGGGAGHDPRGSLAMYEKGAGRDPYHDRPSREGAGQSISRPAPPDIVTAPPPPRSDNFI